MDTLALLCHIIGSCVPKGAFQVANGERTRLAIQEMQADAGSITGSGRIPWKRAWQPTPVFLPGESPWTEKPGGLQSIGSQDTTEATERAHAQSFVSNQSTPVSAS